MPIADRRRCGPVLCSVPGGCLFGRAHPRFSFCSAPWYSEDVTIVFVRISPRGLDRTGVASLTAFELSLSRTSRVVCFLGEDSRGRKRSSSVAFWGWLRSRGRPPGGTNLAPVLAVFRAPSVELRVLLGIGDPSGGLELKNGRPFNWFYVQWRRSFAILLYPPFRWPHSNMTELIFDGILMRWTSRGV